MIDTKPLICKQFTSEGYDWIRQGDSDHKYKTHRVVGKDDINFLGLRWHFITNRIKKNETGKSKFPAELINRYNQEMKEIKAMLNLSNVPDSIIDFNYIVTKVKPFAEMVMIDKSESGFPGIIKVDYDVFLKEFYY